MHYIERLRTEHMKKGKCEICKNWADPLERHHESYNPERTIFLCHKCHWKCHFMPYNLTDKAKEKLLRVRHGFGITLTEDMIKKYIAPGRRPSQLRVRKEVKRRFVGRLKL